MLFLGLMFWFYETLIDYIESIECSYVLYFVEGHIVIKLLFHVFEILYTSLMRYFLAILLSLLLQW